MFEIGDAIVAMDVIEKEFVCNLSVCKGCCCVEGESGAPLEAEEVKKIEDILPLIWDNLSAMAQAEIDTNGVAYEDDDGDLVTAILNGKDCVFTYYDEHNICKCAIEKAYREGKTDFYKPISCHLYPIRLQQYSEFVAVNYHKWPICKDAVKLGKDEGVKIYQFLKEPLIRRFGEKWYSDLSLVAEEYFKTRVENKEKR